MSHLSFHELVPHSVASVAVTQDQPKADAAEAVDAVASAKQETPGATGLNDTHNGLVILLGL